MYHREENFSIIWEIVSFFIEYESIIYIIYINKNNKNISIDFLIYLLLIFL